jgi:DNA (cytosine-5)-methyltransferase 1
MKSPAPSAIKKTRLAAGLSQTAAAALIYKKLRTWQQWESGDRAMDPAFFELFKIKTSS